MTIHGALGGRGFIHSVIGVSGAKNEPFLYATTTAPAQTVTIHRITPTGGNITIYWGDGGTTTVVAGDTASKSHVYAAAATYEIRVTPLILVTRLDIHDAKLSGFRSAQLAGNAMTYFLCYSIGASVSSVVNSADMTVWTPTEFWMYLMPAGTYTINTSDMATWNPTTWYLLQMPAGTYTINTADMATWNPTNWRTASMPAGTYTINTADMATWNPTNLRIYSMPPASTTWTINAAHFSGFRVTTTFRLDDNSLNQAQVNSALWGLYQASVSPRTGVGGTINVAGSNSAPSGIYQPAAACPVTVATPGKEVAHELINDGCAAFANHWTTVTFTP